MEGKVRDCSPVGRLGWGDGDEHTWMVKAVFPTPPSPRTTSLYKVIFPDMAGVIDS